MMWGFVFGNQQLRQKRKNTQLDYNQQDKTIVYPDTYCGDLISKINYHLIQYILSFLELRDLIQVKLTCSLFDRIIRFKILEQEHNIKEVIFFTAPRNLLSVDLSQYSDLQLAGMRISITTQDIGLYPGKNCTSYFTLKLNNQENVGQQIEPEVDIMYNFNELKVRKKDLYLPFKANQNDELSLFMRQINQQNYNILSLNVKGTSICKQCIVKYVKIIIYFYENQ